jgi:hypothetical protein
MTPAMIALIFTLALAMRSVAQGFRALAAVEKEAAGGHRRKMLRARPSRFPAVSLLDPITGKIFSLPTRAGNLVQQFDFLTDSRSRRADFGAENEKLPCFRALAGKFDPARGTHAESREPVALIRGGPDPMFRGE